MWHRFFTLTASCLFRGCIQEELEACVYVCGHIHVYKCRYLCSKKQELLQLRKIKGCICIPQSFVVWPWNMFADTGSVLKVGMGQIKPDENRRKKGLLYVCVHRENGTHLWHCCMGWWKWIEVISKEKEKQEEESGMSVRSEDSWHYMGASSQDSSMDSPCGIV